MNILDEIKLKNDCSERDINTYSPLALAYIGDDVYDLVIRTLVVWKANRPANDLHKIATKYVKAETQAKMIDCLLETEYLSEQEIDVYKRGRNAKSYTKAKNATTQDYRRATGFEALMGYLYLSGNQSRALDVAKEGLRLIGAEDF